jgi:hypothetical protein
MLYIIVKYYALVKILIKMFIKYRVGHEKVARHPFACVLVIFCLALVYCVE